MACEASMLRTRYLVDLLAVVLFAAFESMVLTLLPVYLLREGFAQETALLMASVVVVGDALLQLPIGLLSDRVSLATLFRVCGVLLLLLLQKALQRF